MKFLAICESNHNLSRQSNVFHTFLKPCMLEKSCICSVPNLRQIFLIPQSFRGWKIVERCILFHNIRHKAVLSRFNQGSDLNWIQTRKDLSIIEKLKFIQSVVLESCIRDWSCIEMIPVIIQNQPEMKYVQLIYLLLVFFQSYVQILHILKKSANLFLFILNQFLFFC